METAPPTATTQTRSGSGSSGRTNGGPYTAIGTALANATTYSDTTIASGNTYSYRVIAYNAAGDSAPAYTYASGTTLDVSPVSPQLAGVPVTFIAGTTGGTGAYEYQFYVKGPNDTVATMAQADSTTNTYAWTTPATEGTYSIG